MTTEKKLSATENGNKLPTQTGRTSKSEIAEGKKLFLVQIPNTPIDYEIYRLRCFEKVELTPSELELLKTASKNWKEAIEHSIKYDFKIMSGEDIQLLEIDLLKLKALLKRLEEISK